jgi:hypothetical protein
LWLEEARDHVWTKFLGSRKIIFDRVAHLYNIVFGQYRCQWI